MCTIFEHKRPEAAADCFDTADDKGYSEYYMLIEYHGRAGGNEILPQCLSSTANIARK